MSKFLLRRCSPPRHSASRLPPDPSDPSLRVMDPYPLPLPQCPPPSPTLIADPDATPPRSYKCTACFKQFKQETTFLDHVQKAGHSHHDPKCGVCKKHCRCLDALREHLLGPLAKKGCALEFVKRGCSICLEVFESEESLIEHKSSCQLAPTYKDGSPVMSCTLHSHKRVHALKDLSLLGPFRRSAVALDCEMVGGGLDGSLDICARVCVIDEDENVLLNTYVKPDVPVTDYRFEFTGVHPENLVDAMPIGVVRKEVEKILYNGVRSWTSKQTASLLVGHSLHHDLNCLGIDYPLCLRRDTAFYPPFLRTSNVCNKLQYLVKTYLGYTIQEGTSHDPYEDAVAAMRLYKRAKMAGHPRSESLVVKTGKIEDMNSEELLVKSKSRFQCWCLDA